MAAQKRSSGRNYIDLLESKGGEERQATEPRPSVVRPLREYLLALVTAGKTARSEPR